MPTISIRDLADKASWVIRRVQETKRPFIVTNRGEPVAAVVPLDAGKWAEAMEDWVLGQHPAFAADMAEAGQAVADGNTVGLDDVMKELG
jgi:prevent-host-death family protein